MFVRDIDSLGLMEVALHGLFCGEVRIPYSSGEIVPFIAQNVLGGSFQILQYQASVAHRKRMVL
ncbi:hypothetical protein ASD94_12005 [Acidovorax sp. Root70]|nr:hypothetical protein ASD94_12005 [Acidovorax sp. Root70]